MMAGSSRYTVTVLIIVASALRGYHGNSPRRSTTSKMPPTEECALFKANDEKALELGISTFIDIGEMDVSDGFSLSMNVFPSALNHDGILFSLGSRPNFEYYEWKTAAIKTQFIVVEFIYSALALTLKAPGMAHLQQVELYKTYPEPYSIDDARWHTIKAYRDSGKWKVSIDNIRVESPINNKTDVQLFDKPAFIGGRPGYTDHQFSGVIRNLKVNNRQIQLSGRRMQGLVSVWHCTSPEVLMFTNFLKDQQRRKNTHL